MKCWICNINEKTLRNINLKASDIKRNFGKNSEGSITMEEIFFTSDKDKI